MAVSLLKSFQFTDICPNCGNLDSRRIARKGLLKLIPCRALQCVACRQRYVQLGFFESPKSYSKGL